ncbi:hypothetical protein PF011_g30875, partial [Phytophthora fragariae]
HQENGEKQAALAREYGVTRAAICHIKKNHRDEIITRYDLPDEPRSLPSRRMEAEHEALDIFRYEVLREVQVLF